MKTKTIPRSPKDSPKPAKKGAPAAQAPAAPPADATGSVASRLPQLSEAEIAAAKESFERGILSRGEAVEKGAPLRPGTTHEIIPGKPGGPSALKRKRFSIK